MSLETFVSTVGGNGVVRVTIDLDTKTPSWDGQRIQFTGEAEYFNRGFRPTGRKETIYWVYNAPPDPLDTNSVFK